MDMDQWIQEQYSILSPHLNERQRRLMAAAGAQILGRGGVTRVAQVTGLSRPTIYSGMSELQCESASIDRVRREGGGRKKKTEECPEILKELESLVDPVTRGDPMSPLRWTCKSTRQLAGELVKRGYPAGYRCVAEMLKTLGYSLQANAKTLEGASHPDRDRQFQYINDLVGKYLRKSLPVISVDTKKKELVGQYRNNGKEWRPRGKPEPVNVYDFVAPEVGRAIPYGIYDVGRNLGWVNVGRDHDTASFALESIFRWWQGMGAALYPHGDKLLICADGGGSNGYRVRLWKVELQRFADETGLEVTTCHFPPGTSKWNKIEHRLFSHISMNWRGRPLVSHEVVVELIGATTTESGLSVTAQADTNTYPLKVKVPDEQMKNLNIRPHKFHGEWNYSIRPHKVKNTA